MMATEKKNPGQQNRRRRDEIYLNLLKSSDILINEMILENKVLCSITSSVNWAWNINDVDQLQCY